MPVKNISARMGALTPNGCEFVILSMVSDAATLTVDGVDYAITMTTKLGNDRTGADANGDTHACYFATQTIIGLTAFTNISWSLVQGSNTDSGSFYTAPDVKNSKFSLCTGTCFNSGGNWGDEVSAWDLLRDYIDNNPEFPMLACLFSDDIYYADGAFSASANAENAQGKTFQTSIALNGDRPEYDYALHYASWFGIMDTFYEAADTEHVTPKLSAAQSTAFQYCMSKMAFMPQWGDHEFSNNIAWSGGVALNSYPNPYHQTGATADAFNDGGYDGKGLNTYNDVMLPLQGTSAQDADTHSNHWYSDFGCFRYLSFDPITAAVNAVSVYGEPQMDDMLNLADGGQWFTFVGNSGVAGRDTPAYDAQYTYYNYKDENYIESEYKYLWTNDGQSPLSFMDNPNTNGVMGSLVMTRGDWHSGAWYYWKAPAGAGIVAESIHEICLSTVNTSPGTSQYLFGDSSYFETDNVEMLGGVSRILDSASDTGKVKNLTMTIIEVDGTKSTPEIVIKQWNIEQAVGEESELARFTNQTLDTATDENGNKWRVMVERRIVRHSGDNEGYDLDETPFQVTKSIVAVDL